MAPTAIPWRFRWAQLVSSCVRFRTLPRAERLFAGLGPGNWLWRPYCGGRLWLDVGRSSTERLLFLEGTRWSPELRLLRRLLAPGMKVADVGANIGYYALAMAAAVGPQGTVDSIEPLPANHQTLEHNVTANGLAWVHLHRCAVGAERGSVRLKVGFNAFVDTAGELEVPMLPLDELFPLGVDLVKIDIEGYEGHALAGARQLLSRFKPALFLELHPALIQPPFCITGLLAELGELYGSVELWRPRGGSSWLGKLRARYGRWGVERIAPHDPWWADLEAGQPLDPVWAITRPRGGN